METFNNVVLSIKDFLWGPIMLCLLIGTHVLLTIRTKGIQRKTFTGVKLSVTPVSYTHLDVYKRQTLKRWYSAVAGMKERCRFSQPFWMM